MLATHHGAKRAHSTAPLRLDMHGNIASGFRVAWPFPPGTLRVEPCEAHEDGVVRAVVCCARCRALLCLDCAAAGDACPHGEEVV